MDKNMKAFGLTLLFIVSSTITISGSQKLICTYFTSPKYLEASATEQWIEIPCKEKHCVNERTYRPNQDCKWIIRTEKKNHVVQLTIISMELQGLDVRDDCAADYIDIDDVIDGHSKFKDRLCGTNSGLSFQSSQSEMILHFLSNWRYQYRGFRITYRSVQEPEESADLGLVIGLAVGVFLSIVIVTAMVLLCKRKRKTTERSQRQDWQPDLALSLHDGRPATPPPPYEVMNTESNYVYQPPPSYDSVLRESSPVDSVHVESTLTSNSNA